MWVGIIACDAVIVIRLHTDPRSFSVLEHKACVHLLENTNDLVFSLTLNDICISQLGTVRRKFMLGHSLHIFYYNIIHDV